jgi:hypothetical protein
MLASELVEPVPIDVDHAHAPCPEPPAERKYLFRRPGQFGRIDDIRRNRSSVLGLRMWEAPLNKRDPMTELRQVLDGIDFF